MRQSDDIFASSGGQELDPAMEESISFLSLCIGGSRSSCSSESSVGLNGFFSNEGETFDEHEENENPGPDAMGNESDASKNVPADAAIKEDPVSGKANLEITNTADTVCSQNWPVEGSHFRERVTGASAFSGYLSKSVSQPIDIVYANGSAESEWDAGRTKSAWRRANRRLLSDAKAREDRREKAWERRRGQVLLEGCCYDDMSDRFKTWLHHDFDEVVIDSPTTPTQALKGGSRGRNYLTNVDIDELKGCLDLGFGFNYEEIPELSHTLPALELCYAISQNFLDHDHQKSSPESTLDGADSAHYDSCAQSPIANWKISSPGDHPQEVKARLKVWAQAVACTVRLCS